MQNEIKTTAVWVKCPSKSCHYEGLYGISEELPKARWCTVCGADLTNEEQIPVRLPSEKKD